MENPSENSTAELVGLCLAGDASGFQHLYTRFSKQSYSTALRITNNISDAEDIIQESFSTAFQSLKNLKTPEHFGAWIKKIVVHKSIDCLRNRSKNIWLDDDQLLPEQHHAELEDNVASMEIEIDDIKNAVMTLPDGYRAVLCLHLLENNSQEETAKLLGITHATVRSQYLRAKKKLAEILQQTHHYGREAGKNNTSPS